jgi:hypothetical protein
MIAKVYDLSAHNKTLITHFHSVSLQLLSLHYEI